MKSEGKSLGNHRNLHSETIIYHRFSSQIIFLFKLFTLHLYCSFFSFLPSQSFQLTPSSTLLPLFLRKDESFHGCQPSLRYQFAVRLGVSSIEARPCIPVRRKGSNSIQCSQKQSLILLKSPCPINTLCLAVLSL